MVQQIAILGSTGSIGKNLINIIKKDRKKFSIILLTANKNYNELTKQIKLLNVKNIIINDKKNYEKFIIKNKNKNLKVFNNFEIYEKIFKNKIDYVMSSISGVEGLKPTLNIIKHTKKIAIANKEGIICGWNLLNKEIKKNKTQFIPVDSEHFSIWYSLKNNNDDIEKIFLTASGGPFHDTPLKNFKNIKIKDALKHPNWKMGKKISIDSATMMNKVFEIIEAKKIFDVDYKKLAILTHPQSYIHSIIKFNNGFIKIIAHDTDMKIPIFNTIYHDVKKKIKTKKINLKYLNNTMLAKIDNDKFPVVNILKNLPESDSLFETVLVTANDELVKLFLKNKIKFTDISKKLLIINKNPKFTQYKKIQPKNINDILKLNKYLRVNINFKDIN
jgi:1-deoxy-D-xylulose-5-phosphate reductoisomerase